jgi:hypothetical protein
MHDARWGCKGKCAVRLKNKVAAAIPAMKASPHHNANIAFNAYFQAPFASLFPRI